MSEVYRAVCSLCGRCVAERASDAANLPAENNRGIVESVAGAHDFRHEFRGEIAVVGVVRDV